MCVVYCTLHGRSKLATVHSGGDPAALRLASRAAADSGPCAGGTFGCDSVSFGSIYFETRYWNGEYSIQQGDTYDDAYAAFESLADPDWSSYCSTTIYRADMLSNQMGCSFLAAPSSTDIAFHYEFAATTYIAETMDFRLHVDWGGSGFTCIDNECDLHPGDVWGHVFFAAESTASESGTSHQIKMLGFEDCCDGHAELEVALPSVCTCSDEPGWLMVDWAGDYECHCAGAVTAESVQFFIEEETCSDPEQNHISEVVHLLAIDYGIAVTEGPDTCITQTKPTCDAAIALMNAATLLDSSSLPAEVTGSPLESPHMYKFAPLSGMPLLVEIAALDGIEPHLQVFTAQGLRAESDGGMGGLSFEFPPQFRYACTEESYDGWAPDYEGMVCDMDGTELEAECTRVVSDSDLTPSVEGPLLCVGPPLPDFVYVAVQHSSWTGDGTNTGTDYTISLTSQCAQSEHDADMAWSCTSQADCETATHRWVTWGWCSEMDITGVSTQAACESAGNVWTEEGWCEPNRPCDADSEFSCTNGQCIPQSFKCDGMASIGNAEWPADCSDGSDEGLAMCTADDAISPETGLPYERYSCHAGAIGCDKCTDALSCIAVDCAFNDGVCERPAAGGAPQRSTDPACLIPTEVMTECTEDYCTRNCKAALDAWPWDDAKHGPGGTCQASFNSLGVPVQDVQAARSYHTRCQLGVGCPGEAPREFLLGLEDSYGDGWNGHRLFVKQTAASGSDPAILAELTLMSGSSSAEPLCVPQLATGGFGCLTVEVDSSTACEEYTGSNCWSEEVGWSLDEVNPLTGELSVLVAAFSATGIPGQTWTNHHDACPAAAAAPTGTANPVANEQGICGAGERMCSDGAQCIPENYLCDGDVAFGNAMWGPDCADGSDEVWQWCAHPDRTQVEIPAGLHHYHNNLVLQCASGEATFLCDSNTGCTVSGCQACLHCDDSTAGCLLQPSECIAAGCVWDTSECRVPTSSDPAPNAGCQGLQLAASCAEASEFCPEDCYDSLAAIQSCLGATGGFVSGGASAEWIAQVEALIAGRCSSRGCAGATRTHLRLQLLDSYGDGWNMEPDCTDPDQGCNVYTIATANTANGVSEVTGTLEYSPSLEAFAGQVELCVDSVLTNCVQIHVGAEGTFPEEISWSVKNAATGTTMTPRGTMRADRFYRYGDDCSAVVAPERRFRCYNGDTIPWAQVCDANADCREGEDEAPVLGGFCQHKATCNVLSPRMIGDGWCDDAEDPSTNTLGCGYDGGDCKCLRDYNLIKDDCSFPMIGTGATAVRGDTPPAGRCLDYGTCAQGREFTVNGQRTTVPNFADFTNDCWYIHTPEVYRALTEFSFSCAATFTCSNGDRILESNKCNGWKDCSDGSDEGFTMCDDRYQFGIVSRSFRCIDGTLLDEQLECNGMCNCGNVEHGMCEDEHPIRGDTTCAAQECARRHTDVLDACAGSWPASINADGVQKATCGTMCAPKVVALFSDATCASHLPTGVTTTGAADAVRLCQHVIDHRAQPAFLCRDNQQTTVPIGLPQICDEVDDCGGAEDEASHTPKCPYIVQAEAEAAGVAAQINDCAGNPRDPALLQNGVCDQIDGVEIFNCDGLGSGLDFDAGDCQVTVQVESAAAIAGAVAPTSFIAALAGASDMVDPEMVEILAYTETTMASLSLGGVSPAMLDADTPAGMAAREQIRAGLCTMLNQPVPCSVEILGGSKGRRLRALDHEMYNSSNYGNRLSAATHMHRQMQASSSDIEYTVTSTEPVSSTISGDSYATDVAGAINSGGNALPAIDPTAVGSDVSGVETDIDFVITVASGDLDADGEAQSSDDVGSTLGTALTSTLEDTAVMRAALVANGADICASCRMSTTTGAVQTSQVQVQSTSTTAPPPPPAPVTGRCSGNTLSSENFDCGSRDLKAGASSIVGNDAATCCQDGGTPGLTEEQAVAAAAIGGLLLIILLCCCCVIIVLLVVVYKKKSASAATAVAVKNASDVEVPQLQTVVPSGLERWDTNGDGVLDAAELQAMAAGANKNPAPPTIGSPAGQMASPANVVAAALVAHLTANGVNGGQEEYVEKLINEGFDTPQLFDSLSLEELQSDFGFKRGHLRAVEAWRNGPDQQVASPVLVPPAGLAVQGP